jgi:O-6-methylguanine DNA methyltransferase
MVRAILNHVTAKRRFSGSIDLSLATPFQRLVLEKTREIPAGEVRSYRWVARQIGAERAVRAVGTALARNPVPFLIPCHRVIRTDGSIGRYSGGGPSMKAKMLAIEGVDLERLARLASKRIRFIGSHAAKIFCLPACRLAPPSREPSAAYFATRHEARRSGYRPCRRCHPV